MLYLRQINEFKKAEVEIDYYIPVNIVIESKDIISKEDTIY